MEHSQKTGFVFSVKDIATYDVNSLPRNSIFFSLFLGPILALQFL